MEIIRPSSWIKEENSNGNNNNHNNNNDDSQESTFLVRSLGDYIHRELRGKRLSGMALMATHPRDFGTLLDLERQVRETWWSPSENRADSDKEDVGVAKTTTSTLTTAAQELTIVPCLGVHPWFLHELDPVDDWALVPSPVVPEEVPHWIANLESLLAEHPHLPVGEIGLDNFHFDPSTKELTTPMEQQVEALKLQLQIATRFGRPVSLHCVRAMGKLLDALEDVAEENYRKLSEDWNSIDAVREPRDNNHVLPPRLYFHAFGGKAATATQLVKTLEKPRRIKIRPDSSAKKARKKFVSVPPPKLYFGFAPPVNFQSPKTASVIKAVGLDRLVLETDREDVRNVGPDMEAAIAWISEVLGITEDELVSATNKNARDLYGCCGGGVGVDRR